MEIRYNVTGDRRKELVKVISGITGAKAVYKFMPTCNYEIDYFTVTKNGTLLFDDRADSEEVERVLEGIAAAGFACEAPLETTEEPEEAAQEEDVGLTIAVPLDKVQVGNLTKLLDAKGSLIKKALGINDLRFELQEDRVAFPWFAEPQPEEATAYTHFIAALCRMSKDAKRITAKEKPVDNEKYAFRCFLLRLGFIGGCVQDRPENPAPEPLRLQRLQIRCQTNGGDRRCGFRIRLSLSSSARPIRSALVWS